MHFRLGQMAFAFPIDTLLKTVGPECYQPIREVLLAEKADQKLQSKTIQERDSRRCAWLELSFANFREIN
jgi:hypothetical protein